MSFRSYLAGRSEDLWCFNRSLRPILSIFKHDCIVMMYPYGLAGPKSTTCFENQSFSSQIYVFYYFVLLCSFCDFGPCDFNNEKDRSHVWILIEWAEVIDWSTTNVHFGLLGMAEMTQSITNNFTIKNMTFDRNFTFFHHLRESFNFTSGFRPKYGSNRKVFVGDKSF